MSLEKKSSPHPVREYKSKEFFIIPELKPGDSFQITIVKDGKTINNNLTLGPDEYIHSHRIRIIIYDKAGEIINV